MYLQLTIILNNYFFDNSISGLSNITEIIYPIQFGTDESHYTNTIIFHYIPTSSQHVSEQFGTYWVYANPTIFPTHACLPQITIPQHSGSNITQNTYG